ncbi:hypothetical protein WR164_13280 [Philodulcilactobacillus myokoensis]|uniref:Phosphatidylglycerol lysyltransferase n=1 Tax=Philodulcilactobacillus myokoensis TaxID=2929573 RepID=A0A9W6EU33_9LACO|nr:hypothetical protein WR164_13280 [Philodulcilactobacillus myokoensis]
MTPMFVYDFIYASKTNLHTSKPELMTSSYIINTFTNIGGSGGAVGASLRVFLFGNLESNVETVKIIAQIALFTLSGLVTNDLLAIVLYFTNHLSFNIAMQLVLYCFPLYIIVPFFLKNNTMKKKDVIKILIGSTFEWLACLAFFTSIGFFLNYHYDIVGVYVGVVLAGIIGAISLIPGGLGTFDGTMIPTLHLVAGLSLNQSLLWVVIYRLCYYIIPFLIGLVLLAGKVIRRRIQSTSAKS